MLTFFSLTNFKVFGSRQILEMAPITLIYGPNSGGKSSIIQALLLLKQSIEAPINQGIRDRVLVPKGRYVDLGQSKSIQHKHLFSNQISFEIGMRFPGILNKNLTSTFSSNEEFFVAMNFEHREDTIKLRLPALTGITYRSKTLRKSNLDISLTRDVKQNQSDLEDQLEFEELIDLKSPTNFFVFSTLEEIKKFNDFLKAVPRIRAEQNETDFFGMSEVREEKQKNRFQIGFRPFVSGKTTYLPTSIKNLAKPASEKRFLNDNHLDIPSNALTQVARMMNLQFEKMSYLGPLRSRPKRLYELSQQYEGSIGLSGEFSVEALKSEAQSENSEEINVIDFVNSWLKKFEVPYTISVEDVGDEVLGDLAKFKMLDNRTNVWVAATDVGFGIGQLLPIIIQAALASKKNTPVGLTRTVCIEQPEIHLHPRLQANVADLLIETVQASECQWIIETHSEALMLRIQRRIRDGVLKAEDVAVVFVEPAGENGSRIQNLRLDYDGSFIDEWPGGFFEDSFTEIFS